MSPSDPLTDDAPIDLQQLAADLRAHLFWQAEEGGRLVLMDPAQLAARKKAAAEAPKGPSLAASVKASLKEPVKEPPVAPKGEMPGPRLAKVEKPSAMPAGTVPQGVPSGPKAPPPTPAAAYALENQTQAQLRALGDAPMLDEVRRVIGDCRRCKLCEGRTQIVFGAGNPRARLVFVGEGPGAEEDQQGIPFVGKAGQLLTKMIEAMGFSRDDVYICNVVKCRPPNNRNPEPDEIAACEPFLQAQLRSIKPEVIVALGKFASQTLLRDTTAIPRLRGQWREYQGIPLMPTFHPAYLLRNPNEKKTVWADLQQVMARFGKGPKRGGNG